jgi:hypothetical protein
MARAEQRGYHWHRDQCWRCFIHPMQNGWWIVDTTSRFYPKSIMPRTVLPLSRLAIEGGCGCSPPTSQTA